MTFRDFDSDVIIWDITFAYYEINMQFISRDLIPNFGFNLDLKKINISELETISDLDCARLSLMRFWCCFLFIYLFFHPYVFWLL